MTISKEKKSHLDIKDNNELSIFDIFLILSKQIKVIIFSILISVVIFIFHLLFFYKPIYSAKTKFISSSASKGSNLSGIASQFGFNLSNAQPDQIWVYDDILKSRTLASKLILRKFETKSNKSKELLSKIFNIDNSTVLIDKLISMINVSKNKSTGVYTASISSEDPLLSYGLINALMLELEDHQKSYNLKKSNDTKKFIEERIFDTEKELTLAEEKLKNFNVRNRRIESSPNLQQEQQRIFRDVSVLTGVFTSLKQQLENAKIETVKESDHFVTLDPSHIPLYPSNSKKKILFYIFCFGLAMGLTIAIFLDFLSKSSQKDLEKWKQAKALFFTNLSSILGR